MSESKLNVMFLTVELRPAGAERIVYHLAKGVKDAGGTATVVSIKPAAGAVAQWLADEDIKVFDLGVTSRFDLGADNRLREIIARRHPNVLNTHMFHANVLGRAAARKIDRLGVVSTLHVVERRWRPWRNWLERRDAGRADAIVCVSQAVRRFAAGKMALPQDKLRVILNGIDLSRLEPTALRSDVLIRLGVDPQAPIVGFIGRLDRQKGADVLIRAAARFAPLAGGLRVLMVGSGPAEARLKRLVKETNQERRFAWAGHREDIGNLLQCMDVFAFPSRWEGFGLSLAEAMMAGLPVVASHVDSVPEIVDDGVTAFTVPPDDEEKLANAILIFLQDPGRAKAIGQAAKETCRKRFDLATMVNGYIELFESVAGRNLKA